MNRPFLRNLFPRKTPSEFSAEAYLFLTVRNRFTPENKAFQQNIIY